MSIQNSMFYSLDQINETLQELGISDGVRHLSRAQTETIVQSFSFSLESTLDLPDAVPILETWMDRWKTSESYLFLKQVDVFMCLKSPKKRFQKADEIMDHFVRARSKLEINIAYDTREELLAQWDSGQLTKNDQRDVPRSLFDGLCIQVLHMMKTDVFDRFVRSREFMVFMSKTVHRKGLLWFLEAMDATPKRFSSLRSATSQTVEPTTPRIKRKKSSLSATSSSQLGSSSSVGDEDIDAFLGDYDEEEDEEEDDDDDDDIANVVTIDGGEMRTMNSMSTIDASDTMSDTTVCSTTVLTTRLSDLHVSSNPSLLGDMTTTTNNNNDYNSIDNDVISNNNNNNNNEEEDDDKTVVEQSNISPKKRHGMTSSTSLGNLMQTAESARHVEKIHHLSRSNRTSELSKEEVRRLLKTYIKKHESCQELRVTPFYFKRGLVIVSDRHEKILLNPPAVRDSEKEASAFRRRFHVNGAKRINGYVTRIHLNFSYLQVFNLFYNARNRVKCDGNMLEMGFMRYHSTIDVVRQRLNELMRRKGLTLKDFDAAIEYSGPISYETFKMPFPLTDRFCQIISSMKHQVENKRILVVRQTLRMEKGKKRGMTQMDHVGVDFIEADPKNPNRCTLTMWAAINFGSWMPSNVFLHGISDRIQDQYNNFVTNLRLREKLGILDKETDDTWGRGVLRGGKENDEIDALVLEAKKSYFGASFVPDQAPLDSDTEIDEGYY